MRFHILTIPLLLSLVACQSQKLNIAPGDIQGFVYNHQLNESTRDGYFVEDGSAFKLMLPLIFPRKFITSEDKLWYEIRFKSLEIHYLIHVRLVMDDLYEDKVNFTVHFMNAKTKKNRKMKARTVGKSIIVDLDEFDFRDQIYDKFDGEPEFKLFHNLKPIKVGQLKSISSEEFVNVKF